jgi:hypothetical protein
MSRLIRNRQRQLQLTKEAAERLRETKWFYYCKAAGMFHPNYEDDNFYSEQQAAFFAEYEQQCRSQEDR